MDAFHSIGNRIYYRILKMTEETVKVVVRVRPFLEKERNKSNDILIQ